MMWAWNSYQEQTFEMMTSLFEAGNYLDIVKQIILTLVNIVNVLTNQLFLSKSHTLEIFKTKAYLRLKKLRTNIRITIIDQ